MSVQATSDQIKSMARTFEISKRAKSTTMKKGTHKSNNPQFLDAPEKLYLQVVSNAWDPSSRKFVPIQYIPGANTIFVGDREVKDEDGKPRIIPGLRSQGYDLRDERKRAMDKRIAFTKGVLRLDDYGNDSLLEEFIHNHENNEDRLHKEVKNKGLITVFSFRPLKEEEKATNRVLNFEDLLEAGNHVAGLRKKTKEGSYVYDVMAMNATLFMIEELQATQETVVQRFEFLSKVSMQKGPAMMRIIKEEQQKAEMNVAQAIAFKIVALNSKEAKLVAPNQPISTILEFQKGANQEENTAELIKYLLGTAHGQQMYNTMRAETEVAKGQSLTK